MLASTLFAGAALQSAARPALRPLVRAEFLARSPLPSQLRAVAGPDRCVRRPGPARRPSSRRSRRTRSSSSSPPPRCGAPAGRQAALRRRAAARPEHRRARALPDHGDDRRLGARAEHVEVRAAAPVRQRALGGGDAGGQLERRVPASVYLAALELGALGGLGTFFQTISLSQIPALTAAVLYSTVNVSRRRRRRRRRRRHERDVDGGTWAAWPRSARLTVGAHPRRGRAAARRAARRLERRHRRARDARAASLRRRKVRLSSTLRYHAADEIAVGRLVGQAGCAAAGLGLIDETSAVHELLPSRSAASASPSTPSRASWRRGRPRSRRTLGLLLASSPSGAGATWFQSNGQRKASAPK